MTALPLATLDIHVKDCQSIVISVSRDVAQPCATESVDDTPYSFAFTGKHDSGALLPLESGNVYGHVLSAVQELKDKFETEMRRLIAESEAARAEAAAGGGPAGSAPKRARKAEDGEGEDEGMGDAEEADEDGS